MLQPYVAEFLKFCGFLFYFLKKKVITLSTFFEKNKDVLVHLFTIKRGRYNRPFLHIAAMGVLGIAVVVSPYLADTYPIFSSNASRSLEISSASGKQSIILGEDVFGTQYSKKPRDKIITYIVQKGDTISTIAEKFSTPDNSISADTIRWANDLQNDNITVGDELKILPVTGVDYKVVKGDTVYSIAKKLDTDPQKIVDFPFNDFANPETFALVEGQKLIVPDGVKPSEKPFIKRQVFIAQGPFSISNFGFTWPVHGIVTQFSSWYHTAIDIAAPMGTPVIAGQNGIVTKIDQGVWDGGYGTNLWISDGNGMESHYAHLSGVHVAIGQKVTAGGTVVGWIGMTGRTTGPHIHFEIRKNGVLVNPLAYLQ